MDMKRILTAVIGFPLVMILLIFGNKYIIDVIIAIMAIIAMYEYAKCASNKDIKVVSWISYLVLASIAIIHYEPIEQFGLANSIFIGLPILLLVLFLHVIIWYRWWYLRKISDLVCIIFCMGNWCICICIW